MKKISHTKTSNATMALQIKKFRLLLLLDIAGIVTMLHNTPKLMDDPMLDAPLKLPVKTLPTRITDMDFFQQQIHWNKTIDTRVYDSAAYLLPTGKHGGPRIPCVDGGEVSQQTRTTNSSTTNSAWDYTSFAPVVEEDEITVIFTFSARYCNPDLRLFQSVWHSHILYMPLFSFMPKVLAFDGFGDVGAVTNNLQIAKAKRANRSGVALDPEAYASFQQSLVKWLTHEQNQTKVAVKRMSTNLGPVEMLSKVLPTISTPIIYLAQDDFALNVHVNSKKIIRTMLNAAMGYNNVRYVLLAKQYAAQWGRTFYLQNGRRASGISPNATTPFTPDEISKLYPNSTD